MGNTTKKQHYVWRKYLIPWTNNNSETGKIFVYRKNPRGNQQVIEQRELMKIGFENYYYDISGFSDKDLSVYKQFIEYEQRDQIVKFDVDLKDLDLAKMQKDFIEKEIICSGENIDNEYGFLEKLKAKDHSFYQNSIGQRLMDVLKEEVKYRILFQEETVSDDKLFECFVKYLNMPDEPDIKYEFNLFFCMQYFRSPRIHDNLFNSFEEFKKLSSDLSDLNTKFYVNLITLFYAQKVAINITQNLKSILTICENKTPVPFITGDTPIVTMPGSDAKLTIFHYPISPQIAVHLCVSNVYPLRENRTVTIKESSKVMDMNHILYQNCANEVYSNSKESLCF